MRCGEIRSGRVATILLGIAVFISGVGLAEASRPVRKAIVGCVTDGTLISLDGYPIRVMNARTRAAVDLSRYEGKKVRLSGSLLPGDIYFTDAAPAVLGACTK
jgi:hypothetical protein